MVGASGAPDSGTTAGATVPGFLASFNVLSLATNTLRTEEKFYQSTRMSDCGDTLENAYIIFDTA